MCERFKESISGSAMTEFGEVTESLGGTDDFWKTWENWLPAATTHLSHGVSPIRRTRLAKRGSGRRLSRMGLIWR